MGESIWCLFSVENNYDQPDNNLFAWWLTKPTVEILVQALNYKFEGISNDAIVAIVEIYNGGNAMPDGPGRTRYRLECVRQGVLK